MEAVSIEEVKQKLKDEFSRSNKAQQAYLLWQEQTLITNPDENEFISETAFALAARSSIDFEEETLRALFPRLYASAYDWPSKSIKVSERLLDSQNIGDLYQQAIPLVTRKKFGQFYTSKEIVDYMLDELDYQGTNILNKKILDPACGSGMFIDAIAERFINTAEKAKLPARETYLQLQKHVTGIDINPLALLLASSVLAARLYPLLKRIKQPLNNLPAFDLQCADYLRIDNREKVDFIIANPPYGKKSSKELTTEQSDRFAKTVHGHPNLYGLFMQASVEQLAKNGKWAFINPCSFVSGAYFQKLRTFLKDQLAFRSFTLFEKRTELFSGVLQDVMITVAQKSSSSLEQKVTIRSFSRSVDKKATVEHFLQEKDIFLMQDIFLITGEEKVYSMLRRIKDNSVSLTEAGLSVSTGPIVWNRFKDKIRQEEKQTHKPLLWAAGIRPFSFQFSGNKEGENKYLLDDEKTTKLLNNGPALLIKRLTSKEEKQRVVAALLPEYIAQGRGYFVENHVNIIHSPDVKRLQALSVILNSEIYNYIFTQINGNTQVSAYELRLIPLPPLNQWRQLAQLANNTNQEQKDRAVERAYGVSLRSDKAETIHQAR